VAFQQTRLRRMGRRLSGIWLWLVPDRLWKRCGPKT
jgi:hypothetical protein